MLGLAQKLAFSGACYDPVRCTPPAGVGQFSTTVEKLVENLSETAPLSRKARFFGLLRAGEVL
jgi:hypothetical protein